MNLVPINATPIAPEPAGRISFMRSFFAIVASSLALRCAERQPRGNTRIC
jgi:hypothetical protein